jgi:hypothetical protein
MFRNALGAVCGATRFQIVVVTCAIVGMVTTFAANDIGGPDAFVITPYTTRDYPAALRKKLADDISLPINEPVSATPVKSATRSLWPVPEEDLMVSGLSGPGNLLSRTKETDPLIKSVHLINRWGVIMESTERGVVGRVPLGILLALSRGKEENSTAETALDFIGRASIIDEEGTTVGGILAIFPKTEWARRSRDISACSTMIRDYICAADGRLWPEEVVRLYNDRTAIAEKVLRVGDRLVGQSR